MLSIFLKGIRLNFIVLQTALYINLIIMFDLHGSCIEIINHVFSQRGRLCFSGEIVVLLSLSITDYLCNIDRFRKKKDG